jgi:hypothetical protein
MLANNKILPHPSADVLSVLKLPENAIALPHWIRIDNLCSTKGTLPSIAIDPWSRM